jgi:TPP-dependent pyruvate/acetoin dehydrogenase alpha subunit
MGDLEGLETEHLLSLYRRMLLIRMFEDRVYYLFLQGEIAGTLHQYQGQEAVAVGVCDHLSHSDWITSTHRPHGHALAKGVSTRAAMAELYAKVTGCCGGKGGSMHLGDPSVGMLPAIAIVGGGNSVVAGMGLAFKLRKSQQAAVCFFGEGATNEGAFHESLNFASVKRLPILYVCENNLYGASTLYHDISARRCGRALGGVWRQRADRRWHGCAGRTYGDRRCARADSCERWADPTGVQDLSLYWA